MPLQDIDYEKLINYLKSKDDPTKNISNLYINVIQWLENNVEGYFYHHEVESVMSMLRDLDNDFKIYKT